MVLSYKGKNVIDSWTDLIIYGMYRAGEVSVHRACCERATQPYFVGGGGGGLRFIQAQEQVVTTRSPRIITEFTYSMLIKMYVHAIRWRGGGGGEGVWLRFVQAQD